MTAQIFEFDGPRGYRLSGKLDLPTSEPQGWAIFAHCFTCGKDSLAASRLARALAARGIGFCALISQESGVAEAVSRRRLLLLMWRIWLPPVRQWLVMVREFRFS